MRITEVITAPIAIPDGPCFVTGRFKSPMGRAWALNWTTKRSPNYMRFITRPWSKTVTIPTKC